MTAPVIDFPTPPDRTAADLCTCPGRDAERQQDGEIPLADWIAFPLPDRDRWLILCPNCGGATAEQRREALQIALDAAKAAERAVGAVAGARTRARRAIHHANAVADRARLIGAQGTPPRLTAPPDL